MRARTLFVLMLIVAIVLVILGFIWAGVMLQIHDLRYWGGLGVFAGILFLFAFLTADQGEATLEIKNDEEGDEWVFMGKTEEETGD